jgi:hypothetical protein
LGPSRCKSCCGRSEAELAAYNNSGGGVDNAKGGGVGDPMGAVAGGNVAVRVRALPVDPLVIQSGQAVAVAPVGVDDGGSGRGGS